MTETLKTRRQWRKQDFRKVRPGEQPAAYTTIHFTAHKHRQLIGPVTKEWTEPVEVEKKIALFSLTQTEPYQRIGATLLRDAYCRYFVDDAQKDTYLWWQDDEWKTCRSYLSEEHVRRHLLGKDIYGVYGSQTTCFSAIDADYHGGDYEVFRDQLTAVLRELHGRDGWHYSFGPRGCHILRTHPRTNTAKARSDLRQLLQGIDAKNPELRIRTIEAGMKPISDWEIYPDPKQGFRLPLARGRTVLLDKPCPDLKTYVEWQTEPSYCPLEDVLAQVFKVIQPRAGAKPAKSEKEGKPKREKSEVGRVFGSLRGRYAKVLVDFWSGMNNPPDSLNCAIILTARMMPFYYKVPQDAVDYIEELIDDLPDVGFSDRLSAGKRNEVSRIVRQAVKAVYGDNSHQPNPQLSSEKLAKTYRAWTRKGFSLVDPTTWKTTGEVSGDDFSWSVKEIQGIAYLSKILKADIETTADATRHFLRLLAGHATGEMSVKYIKHLLEQFGISCGHHGKVNEYLNALRHAGWISQVAGYVPGRRGRRWQVGERMAGKFTSLTTTNKPPSASIFVSHSADDEQDVEVFSLTTSNKNPSASIFVS